MNNNKQKYDRSRRIARDIYDMLTEPEDRTDTDRDTRLKENPEATELLAKLADEHYLGAEMDDFASVALSEAPVDRFAARLGRAVRARRRRRRLLYASSAAAAILVATVVWNLAQPAAQSIMPFTPTPIDKPTLVAGDGRQFDLTAPEAELTAAVPNILVDDEGLKNLGGAADITAAAATPLTRIIVPQQYTYNITLEDGTLVKLNANSELAYPANFGDGERTVELRGEAWFDVRRDEGRPFVVNTGGLSVRVYGTEFNINSNKTDRVEVLLVSGSVGVSGTGSGQVMLSPSQLFSYDTQTGRQSVETVDPESYLAWRSGYFITELRPLGELMDDISSWYGVRFVCGNPEILKAKLSVMIDRNMGLAELLETLQAATGIKIIKQNEGLYELK